MKSEFDFDLSYNGKSKNKRGKACDSVWTRFGYLVFWFAAFASTAHAQLGATPYAAPSCTANDASVSAIATNTFSIPAQCTLPTDTATVEYNVTYTQNASKRYDLILGIVYNNQVVAQEYFSDVRTGGANDFQDLDGENDKGDYASTAGSDVIVQMDFPCDLDGDGQLDTSPTIEFAMGYNAAKSGSGLASFVEGPKCALSEQVLFPLTTSLTLVKEVTNDDGGSSGIDDFGLSTSAGTLFFDLGTTVGSVTTYTSDPIAGLAAGTYTFSELDLPNYSEGTWSCTDGVLNNASATGASITLESGDNPVCTISNNDTGASIVVAPVDDTGSSTSGTAGTAVSNVTANDTIDGAAVVLGSGGNATISEFGTWPSGFSLDPATGAVAYDGTSLAPGDYTMDYELCDLSGNCETATVTVTIGATSIEATSDNVSGVNGLAGGTSVVNVLDNDNLDGSPLLPSDVVLTVESSDSGLTLNPDGTIDVAPGLAAGTYELTYTICEVSNPTNCSTATVTITVDSAPIAAADDRRRIRASNTGDAIINVLDNDTLDGGAIDPANVTLTVDRADSELTLNPDGTVDLAEGAPAGTYEITYTVCETLNPSNCATATATIIVVSNPIQAIAEEFEPMTGLEGGVTGSVLASDLLGGKAVEITDVNLTVDGADSELSLDTRTGVITVAPNTPAGTYELTYTICEKADPANCSTVTETITVEAAVIEAGADSVPSVSNREGGQNVINVLSNDTLNGEAVEADQVVVSEAPGAPWPDGFTLNPDGSVDVVGGLTEGEYVLEYQICEILNPSNCDTATISITIDPPLAELSGVVFLDSNSNGTHDRNEDTLSGWIVSIRDEDGNIVAEIKTDENGYYETELELGHYTVDFINPENGAVYGSSQLDVSREAYGSGAELDVIVNLPIDPSGVVYDSITREPISGVTLTMVDANSVALPDVCFIAPSQQNQVTDTLGMYRFDIVPGAAAACPVGQTNYNIVLDVPATYQPGVSTIIDVEPGFFTAPVGEGAFQVQPQATAPQLGEDTTYYLGFTLGAGSRDVIHNHIPLDPIGLVRSDLTVAKVTPRRDVQIGDLVPYEISVTNTEDLPRVNLDIIDYLPAGLRYVDETARLDQSAVDPAINGRELRLTDLDFAPNETRTLSLMVVVGAGVNEGIYTNQAYVEDRTGAEVSNRGEASIRVVPDPVFDCSEVIGKVFDDKNGDGYQDKGELGLAGVRLATVKGLLVTTDKDGKYHVTCAAVPNGRIGSNFILKLDERTLPVGFEMTSENPRVVRLTRGKTTKLNFGVSKGETIALDLTDDAFVLSDTALKPDFQAQLASMIETLAYDRVNVQLNYAAAHGPDLAQARMNKLIQDIRTLWKGDQHQLTFEKRLISPTDFEVKE